MRLVDCDTCKGTGRVKRVPYYSNPMPPEREQGCEVCNGLGKFEVVSGDYVTITEAEAKTLNI